MTAPASTPGTAVARQSEEPKNALRKLDQDAARVLIEPLLDAGRSYEAVVSEVRLAAAKNPEIMQCTADSVVTAVARAVNTGGTIGRDIHLVPFNVNVAPKGQPKKWEKRLEMIEDYKFLREIILRTGGARRIVVKPRFANEAFQYEEGIPVVFKHVPEFEPSKRGALVGAYAYAQVGPRPTDIIVEVMHRDEIQKILSGSKQWSNHNLDDIVWYALKTVMRRLAKALPKNQRLAKLLQKFGIGEDAEELPDGEPALPASPFHGHAKELKPLAAEWSRSTPLANQADGFGYGGADETPLAPEAIQAMRDEPDPFTGEQTTDGELPLGEPPVRAVRRSAQGEGR